MVYVTVALVLLTLLVAIVLVGLWSDRRRIMRTEEARNRSKNQRQQRRTIEMRQRAEELAAEIVNRGGPASREEYFFLFPAACRNCGSRQLDSEETFDRDPNIVTGDLGANAGTFPEIIAHKSWCARCRTEQWARAGYVSPLLTPEQAARIPEVIPGTTDGGRETGSA